MNTETQRHRGTTEMRLLGMLRAEAPDCAFGVQAGRQDLTVGRPAGIEKVAGEFGWNMRGVAGFRIEDAELPIPGRLIERRRNENLAIPVDGVRRQRHIAHTHVPIDWDFLFGSV